MSGKLDQAPDVLVKTSVDAFIEHFENKNMERAQQAAQVLVEMRPTQPVFWASLAAAQRALGRKVPSLDAIRKSVELDPTDREHVLVMGELLIEVGKPLEGVELVQAVFDEGHVAGVEPAKQDPVTIRAGAILEGIQKGLAAVRESREERLAP